MVGIMLNSSMYWYEAQLFRSRVSQYGLGHANKAFINAASGGVGVL